MRRLQRTGIVAGTSSRKIYFPACIYYDLKARKEEYLERLKRSGRRRDPVCAGDCGRPLHTGTLRLLLRKLCKLAGLAEEGYSP